MKENGWIQIKNQYPDSYTNSLDYGWVLGEFFGEIVEGEYQAFEKPVTYITVGDRIVARCNPSILSADCGFCQYSGTKIKVVGRKGIWLKTEKGKWIYHELIREVKN